MDTLFYTKVANSTAHRPVRDTLSDEVRSDPDLLPVLLEIAMNPKDQNHYKACWILELVLEKHLDWITPYLDTFTTILPSYSHDGAVRSISKIGMFLARQHLKNAFLSEKHIQQITEACFDWLINDEKVATKAYAMRTLFELGKQQEWIYPELKIILQKDYMQHSAAYKAASRDVLKRMEPK